LKDIFIQVIHTTKLQLQVISVKERRAEGSSLNPSTCHTPLTIPHRSMQHPADYFYPLEAATYWWERTAFTTLDFIKARFTVQVLDTD